MTRFLSVREKQPRIACLLREIFVAIKRRLGAADRGFCEWLRERDLLRELCYQSVKGLIGWKILAVACVAFQ